MVNSLTMNVLIVLSNALAIAVIFLIAVYLWLDKKRFHLERQFRAAEHLFGEWMQLAGEAADRKDILNAYRNTKNISAKYRAIGDMTRAVWGRETPAMKTLAEELSVFTGVYYTLAEKYNRQLNSRFTGRIARLLGFKKFPDIQMETEHV